MLADATDNGAVHEPLIRQRLMEYYTKIQLLRINGLRSLSATLAGSKDLGVAALGATNKMFLTEMHKAAMELALDIKGRRRCWSTPVPPAVLGRARRATRVARPPWVSSMMSAFFFSRSETIWGGTSQIQRNIAGERVLGSTSQPAQ